MATWSDHHLSPSDVLNRGIAADHATGRLGLHTGCQRKRSISRVSSYFVNGQMTPISDSAEKPLQPFVEASTFAPLDV